MSVHLQKQVRFNDHGRRSSHINETLTFTSISDDVKPKKKTKKKRTKLQQLKAEKNTLSKELKATKKGIKQDSRKKGSEDYTPYENRQRLARSTSEIQSRMKQLDSKILTTDKVNKEKAKKSVNSKVRKKYIRADKQHKRIIKMTGKLERIKLDEENLRAEILRESSRPLDSAEETAPRMGSTYRSGSAISSSSTSDALPVIELGKWRRLSRDETLDPTKEDNKVEPGNLIRPKTVSPIPPGQSEELLERRKLSLHNKTIKADQLESCYELTRELRNTIHEHMITRSYSFSYFNIIPPYKRRKPKPQKSKQFFNRKVYEDRIAVADYSQKYGVGKIPVVKM